MHQRSHSVLSGAGNFGKISAKVRKFLEKRGAKSEIIKHRTVYTAYDKAQTLKVSEKEVGKTLIVSLDKRVALVLISANKNLDKNKLKKLAKCKKIDFATEKWMKKNLKGVKVGAVPPFGSLWGLSTFVDRSLLTKPKIIVNAGNYNFSIKLSPKEFKKMIPDLIVGNFTKARKKAKK